jgi:hypothetical protein
MGLNGDARVPGAKFGCGWKLIYTDGNEGTGTGPPRPPRGER